MPSLMRMDDSSDDGLFDQPETVVVQHRDPTRV